MLQICYYFRRDPVQFPPDIRHLRSHSLSLFLSLSPLASISTSVVSLSPSLPLLSLYTTRVRNEREVSYIHLICLRCIKFFFCYILLSLLLFVIIIVLTIYYFLSLLMYIIYYHILNIIIIITVICSATFANFLEGF